MRPSAARTCPDGKTFDFAGLEHHERDQMVGIIGHEGDVRTVDSLETPAPRRQPAALVAAYGELGGAIGEQSFGRGTHVVILGEVIEIQDRVDTVAAIRFGVVLNEVLTKDAACAVDDPVLTVLEIPGVLVRIRVVFVRQRLMNVLVCEIARGLDHQPVVFGFGQASGGRYYPRRHHRAAQNGPYQRNGGREAGHDGYTDKDGDPFERRFQVIPRVVCEGVLIGTVLRRTGARVLIAATYEWIGIAGGRPIQCHEVLKDVIACRRVQNVAAQYRGEVEHPSDVAHLNVPLAIRTRADHIAGETAGPGLSVNWPCASGLCSPGISCSRP